MLALLVKYKTFAIIMPMANTKQAKKMVRKIKKRTEFNNWWKKRVKSASKEALNFDTAEAGLAKVATYQKNLDKAAKRNIISRNRANRLKSQMFKKVNAKIASLA